MTLRSRTPWRWLIEDYSRIRHRIEAVFGDFEDFNRRVAAASGFRLPVVLVPHVPNLSPPA